MSFILIIIVFVFLSFPGTLYGQNAKSGKSGETQEKKAEVGIVEEITDTAVIIEEPKNKTKYQASIDKNTKIINNKKNLKSKDIKVLDKVAIISSESATATDEGKVKKAIKVYVKSSSEAAQLKRHSVHGIITNISETLITLAHQIHTDTTFKIRITPQTSIKMKATESATLASLTIGQRVVAMGTPEADMLIASKIHIIPGLAKGVFKKIPLPTVPNSTPSATPTNIASPTATTVPISQTPSL